ncbi:alginate lyase family protein [Spongiivirga citrea]|uniref:Alginate lyase n=1 Tax=Spongiivirga citrea TaxID=1481457 RepID=A0A6M0CIW2_9FLAO|nr:alginate lyase family protein [Spongiivirga citrea]NER17855.1 alginate lyase [Spongiivirga citrea]
MTNFKINNVSKNQYFFVITIAFFLLNQCKDSNKKTHFNLIKIEKERVLALAKKYTNLQPITVTDSICERSAGGIHDFYSEGDYWWPDPENPKAPYIRKDGVTNPNNFTAHREAMIRFSQISGALASAYIITKNEEYVRLLLPHLKAWFIDEATYMNPNLLYGQAISGRVTGRGIGIIDTIHLMEVAKAIMAIENSSVVAENDLVKMKEWFATYLKWITTHEYGIKERDNGNNHSVCWALQAAVFADLTDNEDVLNNCRTMYKEVLLPQQMASNGSFPKELERTKPYGYSLFVLDAMTAICQVASTQSDNLFEFTTSDKKNISLGVSFLYPFISDKSKWPYQKDVMYWNEWPVRHPSLLFTGLYFDNNSYLSQWESLPSNFDNKEVIRNMPIRFPLLWVN